MNFDNIHTILIDLDNTLYPHSNGIWRMIRDRINQFLVETLHFSTQEAERLRPRLWRQYGTTLRGLQEEFGVDMDAYLAYVHDVPLDAAIQPNPALAAVLDRLPQRKVIFTNGSAPHARRVMDLVGVADQFEAVVDIYTMAPYCKPQEEAFSKALAFLEVSSEGCLLVDDMPDNLDMARQLGMATIAVGEHQHPGSPHVATIEEIGAVLGLGDASG